MEFKVNREVLTTHEVVYDSTVEQAIELDYILPDYLPDVFKLLKCQVTPNVISYNINATNLSFEMSVCIKYMYYSEQSTAVRCVDQKLNYTKTVDLGSPCENPMVKFMPRVDYMNPRVVNQRRVDLRGAVSVKIKVSCEQKQKVVSDVFGMNAQLKKMPVSYCASKLNSSKKINISENFDLGYSKPAISNIIRADAVINEIDKKIIANKVVAKGEALVNMLYSCIKDGIESMENMQFSLPFSQIIDMDGVDEQHNCIVNADIVACDLIPKSNDDGENKSVDCDMTLNINCKALKNGTVDLVTDAYSTSFPCEFATVNAKIEKMPVAINDSFIAKSSIEYNDGNLENIHDVWCKINTCSSKTDAENKKIVLQGSVTYSVMASNENGTPVLLETDTPFEHEINVEMNSNMTNLEMNQSVVSCSYNMASTNAVEIKAEIKAAGTLTETTNLDIISDIDFDDSTQKTRDGNYALKLYFADENEDIWDIAKKYSTSVAAIMEENDLSQDKLDQRGMILIPIVG